MLVLTVMFGLPYTLATTGSARCCLGVTARGSRRVPPGMRVRSWRRGRASRPEWIRARPRRPA